MAEMLAPGVTSKIVQLSSYIEAVTSSAGFLCMLSKRGRDNELVRNTSMASFIQEFGTPNLNDYGRVFGMGPYVAYNFMKESPDMSVIRVLPDNATYANILVSANFDATSESATIQTSYVNSLTSYAAINTALEASGSIKPICILYPIGRGIDYNKLSVRFTEHANPLVNDVYYIDIYDKQNDGSNIIIESFEVSFDPTAVDDAGDSLFLPYVLDKFSNVLRADMTLNNGEYSPGFDTVIRKYATDLGDVSVVVAPTTASLFDSKQSFSDFDTDTTIANYMVVVTDTYGNSLRGWLGAASGTEGNTVAIYNKRNFGSGTTNRGWIGDTTAFDSTSLMAVNNTFYIKKCDTSIATAFSSSSLISLKRGSDGDLINAQGNFDTTVAATLLSKAYAGLIVNPKTGNMEDAIFDRENFKFNLIFDAGYPVAVKTQIASTAKSIGFAHAILDAPDDNKSSLSVTSRKNSLTFNHYSVSMYSIYTKVNDVFTGKDIWVPPTFHAAYVIPRNDKVNDIFVPAAGLSYGVLDGVLEARYYPKGTELTDLYSAQLNPIIKLSGIYTFWGCYTSQIKPGPLTDVPIVRLVEYIDEALQNYAKKYIFSMNNSITWANVENDVRDFLEAIKTKRGLYEFSVEVGASDYEIKLKKFHVNTKLRPTRHVKNIELTYNIE